MLQVIWSLKSSMSTTHLLRLYSNSMCPLLCRIFPTQISELLRSRPPLYYRSNMKNSRRQSMPCYLSKLCTKDWRLLFPHTPSEKECASLCILLWIPLLWTKNLAIWVRDKYIMKMGEKRRKNFPLVTLFVVRSTIPAIPNPTNKSLCIEVSTQQEYWWFSWPRDNFRRHWALWLLFIKFQKNQRNLMMLKLCKNTDKLKYNIMKQFPCNFRHHHLLNKTDQQLCKILPGQIL